MIKLSITRTRPYTEEEKADMDKIRNRNGQWNVGDYPPQEVADKVLEVEITEAQFEALRKGALETF